MNYYAKLAEEKKNSKEEKDNGVSYDLTKAIIEEGKKRGLSGSELNRWVAEKVRAFDNSKEEKSYYAELIEKKNANAYYTALSLIKDGYSAQECIKQLVDNYHFNKTEACKALEKAANDLHKSEIAKIAKEQY